MRVFTSLAIWGVFTFLVAVVVKQCETILQSGIIVFLGLVAIGTFLVGWELIATLFGRRR